MRNNGEYPGWTLFLKVLFILLNFIFPAIIILWGSSEYGPLSSIPLLKNIIFGLLFFLVFPVSIAYLIVSMNRVFPKKIRSALLFFLPHILNILIYLVRFGFSEGFLSLWMVQSLPLFLGYILALIIGFLLLFIGKMKESGTGNMDEIPGKVFLALFLILTFPACWLYMYITGIRFLTDWNTTVQVSTAVGLFLVSIFMVFLFHFKLLAVLYKEGKL